MTPEESLFFKHDDCTFEKFGIAAHELCRLSTFKALPFWAMKHFRVHC